MKLAGLGIGKTLSVNRCFYTVNYTQKQIFILDQFYQSVYAVLS